MKTKIQYKKLSNLKLLEEYVTEHDKLKEVSRELREIDNWKKVGSRGMYHYLEHETLIDKLKTEKENYKIKLTLIENEFERRERL